MDKMKMCMCSFDGNKNIFDRNTAFISNLSAHFDIVSKDNVGLKTLLLQGSSESEFYSDLVYKFKKKLVKMIFLIISKYNYSLKKDWF